MGGGELRLGASPIRLITDRPLSLHAGIIISVFLFITRMTCRISISSKYAICPSISFSKGVDRRIGDGGWVQNSAKLKEEDQR